MFTVCKDCKQSCKQSLQTQSRRPCPRTHRHHQAREVCNVSNRSLLIRACFSHPHGRFRFQRLVLLDDTSVQVPMLEHRLEESEDEVRSTVLLDSYQIVMYLERTFPRTGASLLPRNPAQRELIQAFIECFEAHVQVLNLPARSSNHVRVALWVGKSGRSAGLLRPRPSMSRHCFGL